MSATIPLTNLIPDPAMRLNGWSGAAYDTAHSFAGNRSLKLTGTTSTPEVVISTTAGIVLNPTHIYYSRMYGWQDTKTNASVGFYWPIAEPSFREGISIGDAGQWNLYSGRNGRTSFSSGSYQLRLDFNNGNQAGVMYLDGVMLVDLTAAFGAVLEPDQGWCDRNIPFFEGTTTLEIFKTDLFEITSAAFAPNPAKINQSVSLAVTVVERAVLLEPYYFYAGEIYGGEI